MQSSVYRKSSNFFTYAHTYFARLLSRTIDADVNLSFERRILKTKRDHICVIIVSQMRPIHLEQRFVVDKNDVDTSRLDALGCKHALHRFDDRRTNEPRGWMCVDHLNLVP